jgi:predicted O-methyltransferase YrrM
MIDPWRPLERWNKPFNTTNEKFDDIYHQAMARTAPFKDKITVLRNETRAAAPEIEDGSLDLVYIDGDHTLRGVTIDLIATFEKVRPGGFIGGDDFTANIWQHGRKFEPTLVCPFAVYFAEAVQAEIFILPFDQFLIQRPCGKGGSFSLKTYVPTNYKLDLLSRL